MIVKLTKAQMKIATGYGKLRHEANRKHRTRDNKAPGMDALHINILGCAGELAVSLATGIEWTGRFTPESKLKEFFKATNPDVGTDIEVRTTTTPNGMLFVHRNDPTEWRFVLVRPTDHKRKFNVVGWQYGKEIKVKKLWNANIPYPAFGYPSAWLRPIEELLPDQGKDYKHLTALLQSQGYAVIDSTRLGDRIVVIDSSTVEVPLMYAKHIRYTVEELALLGEIGDGHETSTAKLRAIHVVKEHLGGVVVK